VGKKEKSQEQAMVLACITRKMMVPFNKVGKTRTRTEDFILKD
jgi:hypothetical protein